MTCYSDGDGRTLVAIPIQQRTVQLRHHDVIDDVDHSVAHSDVTRHNALAVHLNFALVNNHKIVYIYSAKDCPNQIFKVTFCET